MNRRSYFKLAAILISILLTLILLYFVTFEASIAIHHCTGTNCPICHELHMAELITAQLNSETAPTEQFLFLAVLCQKIITVILSLFQERNLIIDKVRMDD